jgi:hypothetical protein
MRLYQEYIQCIYMPFFPGSSFSPSREKGVSQSVKIIVKASNEGKEKKRVGKKRDNEREMLRMEINFGLIRGILQHTQLLLCNRVANIMDHGCWAANDDADASASAAAVTVALASCSGCRQRRDNCFEIWSSLVLLYLNRRRTVVPCSGGRGFGSCGSHVLFCVVLS